MTRNDLYILMLEDEHLDAELNKAQLMLIDEYNCNVTVVKDKGTYLNALENSNPDIVLSDYNLPQYNGLEALNDLKARKPLIPFIFVTGTMSEEIAADTIKAGAWDYVVKDRLFRLPFAVRSVLHLKEEKMAALQAEEYSKRLLAAIEQSSAQMVVSNENGIIEYVNRKFTEVTGLTPEDAVGQSVTLLSFNDLNLGKMEEAFDQVKNGNVFSGEVLSRKKDGSIFWEYVSITPLKNTEGKITAFVILKEDITSRKIMEQELIEARDKAERSDRLKDAFLQNLSHEIRTPLNAIVGFSNLLSTDARSENSAIREYTSIIQESSRQLLSIVTDILTIASIQTGQETISIKPVGVKKLFDYLFDRFSSSAEEKNIQFILPSDIRSDPMIFLSDETKLTQILSNLLNNAFKFTRKGSVELTYTIHGHVIEFSVIDTGIGIPHESQSHIFDRFRQADDSTHIEYGGTGLGLSISNSFAQMLGGFIQLESEPEKGSRFTLTLPFLLETDSVLKVDPKPVIPEDVVLNILIAEDEFNNYLLLKALLKQPNINLFYAENGLEALNICERNSDINMVLMDIKMPVMDGVTAFRRLRELKREIPVIAQTAYGLEREKQQFLEMGFSEYVSKPIKRDDLYRKIIKCISADR